MPLSRQGILDAVDLVTKEVVVPEWGGETVLIKGMTGAERDNFEASNRTKSGDQDLRNMRARFLVRVIVNENGTRIFAEQDAAALGKKSSGAIGRLWVVAAALSGMSGDEEEEAEGNSGAPTEDGADSPSSLPETSDAPELNSSPESVPES